MNRQLMAGVFRFTCCAAVALLVLMNTAAGQPSMKGEVVDSAAVAGILEEGTQRSQVMEVLSYLSDVYGPRLTGSPGFKRAAEWTKGKLTSWGVEDARLESWGIFGRGWELQRYSAHLIGSQVAPLLSYPRAWSPGTNGTVRGEVIFMNAPTDSALETYRGKLKGKFILTSAERPLKINFENEAVRETDSHLLELANTDAPKARTRRPRLPGYAERQKLELKKVELCISEGALAFLSPSNFNGGSIQVLSATVPSPPDVPRAQRSRAWDPKAPKTLPQVEVAVEHYNRMIRMTQKGEHIQVEMNLDVKFFKEDSGYNVLAEISGSDLKNEVVMIGAHLDSWHGGTGATDNATGVAVCMEAMRIIKALGLKPRRTIRIGLWGGEEQGEFGSKAYVRRHLVQEPGPSDSEKVKLTPQGENFSVYFNDDNGTGKFRGMFMEGNEAVRPIFRKWFSALDPLGSYTLSLSGTGSTDHTQFDMVGLPGFQFIQDDIEYFSRTWHSTMDLYDRAIQDDLKQGAVTMAAFAYLAAMRDEKIPRKQ